MEGLNNSVHSNTIDLNSTSDLSTSDLDSSVIEIGNEDDQLLSVTPIKNANSTNEQESDLSHSSANISMSPTTLTPATKRKRDIMANDDREAAENAESTNLIDMERRSSPEPRRKNITPLPTPQKTTDEAEKLNIPDVVKDVDFDENLPETVSLLRWPDGGKLYLVGTAHFSIESNNDVAAVIQAVQPHRVVVELCGSRTDLILRDEETILAAAKDINLQKILAIMKKDGPVQGLLYTTLLSMSAHVTKELGMAPGGEFRRAFHEAGQVPGGCVVILGDRPLNVTLSRLLASLSWWQCAKLAWKLVISKESIKKEDVENAKKKDFVEAMLAEMSDEFPSMREILVTERDRYLTFSLQNALSVRMDRDTQPLRVVGVVGMGHTAGIEAHWGHVTEKEVAKLMSIPPPSVSSRVLKTGVRVAFWGGIAYAFYRFVPAQRIVNLIRP